MLLLLLLLLRLTRTRPSCLVVVRPLGVRRGCGSERKGQPRQVLR